MANATLKVQLDVPSWLEGFTRRTKQLTDTGFAIEPKAAERLVQFIISRLKFRLCDGAE